jgi:hypothetical protein
MAMEGRIEKRVGREIPVCLLASGGMDGTEKVVTVNVSPHGARVITKQRWRADDHPGIVSLAGDFLTQGRVVYCQPQRNGNFHVGLEFRLGFVDWERVVTR